MTTHDILSDGAGVAAVADEPADNQLPVHGVLFGPGDITQGLSGKRTRWPADVLETMAEDAIFEGKPLTLAASLDPEQHVGVELTDEGPKLTGAVSMDEKVGEITATMFDEDAGLLFEGFIADWEAEEAVESGLAQVSPVVMRDVELVEGEAGDPDALYEVTTAKAARDVALVADGAVPSNEIKVGSSPTINTGMAEALARHFDVDIAVLQRDRARRPSYSGTETSEWSTPTLDDYLTGYDSLPDPADANTVGDLTQDQRDLIARKSLLGTADGETLREVRFFPVVDPETDQLNSRALGAVRGGRGSQADIPSDARASARNVAEELLAEEFGDGDDVEATSAASVGAQDTDYRGGDDGSDGGSTQSTPVLTDNSTTMSDLTDKEQELLAAARQKDDPTVVEAGVPERLNDHAELIDDAESIEDPTVVETTEYDALQSRVETVEDVFAEALQERTGLSDQAIEAMPFEAMAAEFETDEGDLDVEALTQSPETGSDVTDGEPDGPDEEALARVKEIKTKLDHAEAALPDSRVEALREEAAELADADDYDAAVEVL